MNIILKRIEIYLKSKILYYSEVGTMKKAMLGLVLLITLIAGCAENKNVSAPLSDKISMEVKSVDKSSNEIISETEVRLTAKGFDKDAVTLAKKDSLTIIIADEVNGHYLTMSGSRLSERQLFKGEKINVNFPSNGIFEIIDETSKQSLKVQII